MRAVPKIYKNFGIPLQLALRLREIAEKVGQPETLIMLDALEREVKRVEEQIKAAI